MAEWISKGIEAKLMCGNSIIGNISCGLRSYEALCGVGWYLPTDVSGQRLCLVFERQAFQGDGTGRLLRKFGNLPPNYSVWHTRRSKTSTTQSDIPEDRRHQLRSLTYQKIEDINYTVWHTRRSNISTTQSDIPEDRRHQLRSLTYQKIEDINYTVWHTRRSKT